MPSPPNGLRAPPSGACSVARLRKRSSTPLRRRRSASSYLGRAVPHFCLALPSIPPLLPRFFVGRQRSIAWPYHAPAERRMTTAVKVGCRRLAPSMRTSKSTFPRRCRTSSPASRFLGPPPSSPCVGRGLTPRSRRGPTAQDQAREALRSIVRLAGLALRRRSRLTSNVRPRSTSRAECQKNQRLSA